MSASAIYTFGHGTLAEDDFAKLLTEAGIGRLVDVRSFPGSRRNPQFGREAMEKWVPAAGIDYHWLRELGGRRKPVPGSRHVALRHEAFRAYGDYMETPEFKDGVAELLELAARSPTAVMCSETVWWRCHRRLLADHLVLVEGLEVLHLMHDGRLTAHPPTEGVRATDDGLAYDVGATPPLPQG